MLRPLLLLTILVGLAGCRETVTGPDPLAPPPPPTPGVTLAPLYIKGPATLRVQEEVGYRAEPLQDPRLHHYAWSTYGLGGVNAEADDPTGRDRLIRARATDEGAVLLIVRAYDADGEVIARGAKEIAIRP